MEARRDAPVFATRVIVVLRSAGALSPEAFMLAGIMIEDILLVTSFLLFLGVLAAFPRSAFYCHWHAARFGRSRRDSVR